MMTPAAANVEVPRTASATEAVVAVVRRRVGVLVAVIASVTAGSSVSSSVTSLSSVGTRRVQTSFVALR